MKQTACGLQEQTGLALRALYGSHGYAQYKMNKFEEYDLYANNKDFLISGGIITFTDTNGKLMALKPDVTLSIVKNTRDVPGEVQKLCYTENVYRVSRGSGQFREIMQAGLECIGEIDDYCILEVLELAGESLGKISDEYILDLSHIGLLSGLIDCIGVPQEKKSALIGCIGGKNLHELTELCRQCSVAEADIDALCALAKIGGRAQETLGQVISVLENYAEPEELDRFAHIVRALCATPVAPNVRIDFSVVSDVDYYNGFVFKGFVAGLPGSVLSGGQYDRLMQKMGRSSDAIGFAVYMDALERLDTVQDEYDVDVALVYGSSTPPEKVAAAVRDAAEQGRSVRALRRIPQGMRCREIISMTEGEAGCNG